MGKSYCTLSTHKPHYVILDEATHRVASIKPTLPENKIFRFWARIEGPFIRGKIGKESVIVELA